MIQQGLMARRAEDLDEATRLDGTEVDADGTTKATRLDGTEAMLMAQPRSMAQ